MSNFNGLLRSNADFARTGAKDRVPEVPFIPNKQVYILTCIDPGSIRHRSSAWTSATRSSPAPSAAG